MIANCFVSKVLLFRMKVLISLAIFALIINILVSLVICSGPLSEDGRNYVNRRFVRSLFDELDTENGEENMFATQSEFVPTDTAPQPIDDGDLQLKSESADYPETRESPIPLTFPEPGDGKTDEPILEGQNEPIESFKETPESEEEPSTIPGTILENQNENSAEITENSENPKPISEDEEAIDENSEENTENKYEIPETTESIPEIPVQVTEVEIPSTENPLETLENVEETSNNGIESMINAATTEMGPENRKKLTETPEEATEMTDGLIIEPENQEKSLGSTKTVPNVHDEPIENEKEAPENPKPAPESSINSTETEESVTEPLIETTRIQTEASEPETTTENPQTTTKIPDNTTEVPKEELTSQEIFPITTDEPHQEQPQAPNAPSVKLQPKFKLGNHSKPVNSSEVIEADHVLSSMNLTVTLFATLFALFAMIALIFLLIVVRRRVNKAKGRTVSYELSEELGMGRNGKAVIST